MPTTGRDLFIYETETKPNRYAVVILTFTLVVEIVCWAINELGIFRVGDTEMRVSSIVSILATVTPIILFITDERRYSDPRMKYVVILGASTFTFSVSLLLTFHTTIMLIFPVIFAMLYKSNKLGVVALISSLFCTIVSPVLGYLLRTWDIPLFEELILIATDGGAVTVSGGTGVHSMLNVGKVVLYLVIPRMMMVGSCSVLMKYVIKVSAKHVEIQVELNKINQIDNVTGLFNQNTYKELVKTLKSQEKEQRVGAMFFDVNGMKQLNDTMGHEYGDLLLQRCAKSLLDICDDSSTAAFRVGGDEFLIVMIGATEEYCEKKRQAWEESLKKINEENSRDHAGIHCSMAVGTASGNACDIEAVIKEADSNMYFNKAKMKEKRAMLAGV